MRALGKCDGCVGGIDEIAGVFPGRCVEDLNFLSWGERIQVCPGIGVVLGGRDARQTEYAQQDDQLSHKSPEVSKRWRELTINFRLFEDFKLG